MKSFEATKEQLAEFERAVGPDVVAVVMILVSLVLTAGVVAFVLS